MYIFKYDAKEWNYNMYERRGKKKTKTGSYTL